MYNIVYNDNNIVYNIVLLHCYNVRFVLSLLQCENVVLAVLSLFFIVIVHCSLCVVCCKCAMLLQNCRCTGSQMQEPAEADTAALQQLPGQCVRYTACQESKTREWMPALYQVCGQIINGI